MYKENIKHILIKTIIGFIAAFIILTQLEPDWDFGSWCCMAFFFAAVPYGWSVINKTVGNWAIWGSGAAIVIGLIVKLLLALVVGWIVTPIALIYNIVRLVIESRQEGNEEFPVE